MSRHADSVTRFWSKTARGADSECWLWTGALDQDGYGIFHPIGRERVRAHRYAYELLIGPKRAETCVRQHPLAGVNVRVRPDGKRVCVQCERDRTRERQRLRRAGLLPGARKCSADDCERLAAARGLCDMHYRRQSRKPERTSA